MSEPLIDSLTLAAERRGDIAPAIMERFFALSPSAAALMEHMDSYMCGRMVEQVLLLLMEEGEQELEHYLSFEVGNHEAYGVLLPMYGQLFEAVRDTVREAAGAQWTDAHASAWQQKTGSLLDAISDASRLRYSA
jgi:hypothetical protein